MDANMAEKNSTHHQDLQDHESVIDVEKSRHNALGGFASHADTIRKGYFYSPQFLGTMLATGLGVSTGTGGFGLAAANLQLINNDIGPDANITWVSLVYTLTLAIGLLLVGRLSDLFGRRWFFIGSAALAVLGCIVSGVAQNVGTLIGGTALIGLAASGQLSFAFITGEIVPMKHRFSANAVMYFFAIPFAGFGPAVSKAFILYTAAGWRWCYYMMIIINFASGLCFFLFYYPPTFEEKFKDRSRWQQIKDFDYVGTFLFLGGFIIFLLGLNWGGSVYPWKSAEVIATMVVGGVTLILFALWETFVKLKEPLLPVHLFQNFAWVVACVLLGIGALVYYALSVIWPQMVAVLFTDDGGASMRAGWWGSAPSVMINIGQIVGGFLAEPLGKTRYQCMTVLTIGGACLGAIAYATPDTPGGATALAIVATFFIGWNESVCLSNAGIELLDQREIGTAVGAAGSIRSAISALGSAVFLSVLNNRLAQTVPAEVPPVVTEAGLPESSVSAFLSAFTTGGLDQVDGATAQIVEVGTRAYKNANAQAYSTVFYASIAFTGVAIILSFFSPNVDDKMDGNIAVTLHGGEKEKAATGVDEKV